MVADATERGKAEGREEGKKIIAKNLKQKGIDIQTIIEVTGLSKTEIESL